MTFGEQEAALSCGVKKPRQCPKQGTYRGDQTRAMKRKELDTYDATDGYTRCKTDPE